MQVNFYGQPFTKGSPVFQLLIPGTMRIERVGPWFCLKMDVDLE